MKSRLLRQLAGSIRRILLQSKVPLNHGSFVASCQQGHIVALGDDNILSVVLCGLRSFEQNTLQSIIQNSTTCLLDWICVISSKNTIHSRSVIQTAEKESTLVHIVFCQIPHVRGWNDLMDQIMFRILHRHCLEVERSIWRPLDSTNCLLVKPTWQFDQIVRNSTSARTTSSADNNLRQQSYKWNTSHFQTSIPF